MKKITQKILKVPFVRNIGVLAGSTAIAQLISIVSIPILTRLYTPNDFSLLAVYSSIIAIISVVACLRFEIAIPLPRLERSGSILLLISLLSVTIISICLILLLLIFQKPIISTSNIKIGEYIWLIPIGVFLSGCYKALQYWATRNKAFNLISKTRLTQAIGGNIFQLGLGLVGFGSIGLIFGQIINYSSGIIPLSRYYIKNQFNLLRGLTYQEVKAVFKEYDRFPKYSVLEALANTASTQAPVIIIAYYALGAEAGYLMIATRLLSLPVSLIGSSIAQVYLSEAPEKYKEGELSSFTFKIMINLAKIGILPMLLAGIISPFIIPLILGSKWQQAGIIISWMVPWYLVQFITSPVSMTLHITNNQRLAMFLQFIGFLLRIVPVIIAGIFFKGWITEVYAISGFLFYTLYLIVVISVVKKT